MWKVFLNKSFLQKFKWQIIIGIGWSIISSLFVPVIIAMIILGPLAGAISGAGSSASGSVGDVSNNDTYVPGTETGNFWENLANFATFRGFQSNETIFYQKLKDLISKYGNQLDIPLILSTLYYPFDVVYNQKINNCLNNEELQDDAACEKIIGDYNNSTQEQRDNQSNEQVAYVAINGRLDALVNNMIDTATGNSDYDKYKQFLIDHYIKESPEFGSPWGIDDSEKLSQRVSTISQEIESRASYYNTMFRNLAGGTDSGDYVIKTLVAKNLFDIPVKGAYHISSCFGNRKDPSTGAWTQHNGTDVVIEGDDKSIYAAADGIVILYNTGVTGSCYPDCASGQKAGNYVELYHNVGGTVFTTLYAHLSSVESSVMSGPTTTIDGHTGVQITKGTKIGVEGSTGNATGAHLHFEVRTNGVTIMPSGGGFQTGTPVNPGSIVFKSPTSWGDNCPQAGSNGNRPATLDWPNPKVVEKYPWAVNLRQQIMNNSSLSSYRKAIIDRGLSIVGWVGYERGNAATSKYRKIGWNPCWERSDCGLDCSGYTEWAYVNAGIYTIGAGSINQCWSHAGHQDLNGNYSALVPGDLVCRNKPGTSSRHVAIYFGYYDGKYWILESYDGVEISLIEAHHSKFTRYISADVYINALNK